MQSVCSRIFMLLKCLLLAKYSPQQKMLVYCVTHWHPLAKLYEPPWNVLWARNQPLVPDLYSQSLVCATWTIPTASTQISLPQSYESKVLTSPFSLIAHFFPGFAIVCLTPSLYAFCTMGQMVWWKTIDNILLHQGFSSEYLNNAILQIQLFISFGFTEYLRNWICSGGRLTFFKVEKIYIS